MDIDINDILLSFLRWILGLSFGSILGLLLYFIEFVLPRRYNRFNLIFNFLRAIPIIGFVPLIIITIGVKEYGKIALIVWGVMFPVWISVRSASKGNYKNAELMLKGIRINKKEFTKFYTIPKILGGLIEGVKIGIGIAWLCVVAAEWVGTYNKGFWGGGLGYKLIVAQDENSWISQLIILGIFGTLGIITSAGWYYLNKAIFKKLKVFNPVV